MATSAASRLVRFPNPKPYSLRRTPRPYPSFRAAKSAMKNQTNSDKLTNVFTNAHLIPTLHNHEPLFNLAVDKFLRFNRPDHIHRAISHSLLKAPGREIGKESFWLSLVRLYGRAGMVDHAHRVFDVMLDMGCKFSERSLVAILGTMLRNGVKGDVFHGSFQLVCSKVGVAPGVESCNLVLRACCESGRVDLARELVDKWNVGGGGGDVSLDIESYNVLLGAYLKRKEYDEFDKVVEEVVERGLKFNLTTYNHRITRFCKSKKCAEAKLLLDAMLSEGVKPDSSSYNALVFGFCRSKDFKSAREVIEKMEGDRNVPPPSFGYFTLLRYMVDEGDLDGALEICNEIIERKWIPPLQPTKALVEGLVKMWRAEDAKGIVEKVKKRLKGSALDSWRKVEMVLPPRFDV